MPAVAKFFLENGQVNLDLTSRILKSVASQTLRWDKTNTWKTYCPITARKENFNVHDAYDVGRPTIISSTGSRPPSSEMFELSTCLKDGIIYYIGGGWTSGGTTDLTADVFFNYVSDNWSGGVSTDKIRIYSQDGKLMWSDSTLKSCPIYISTLEFTSLNQVKTISSPNDRRLYINEASVFVSGTIVIDEGGSFFTTSGLQVRWSNQGKTLECSYISSGDGDITEVLRRVGKITVEIFEFPT